jgi:hypothetical protein
MGFPKGSRGYARMRELALEDKAEIDKAVAHLIAGLKRPPTPIEECEAELIASTMIKARRQRERCRDDSSERRMLKSLLRDSSFGQVPAPSPAEIQCGPEVAAAYERHNKAWQRQASREPWEPPADEQEAAADDRERGGEPAVNSTVNAE